jgi:hypothetical protein
VTSGGNVTLNAADTNLTVKLDATTNLGLGSLGCESARNKDPLPKRGKALISCREFRSRCGADRDPG